MVCETLEYISMTLTIYVHQKADPLLVIAVGQVVYVSIVSYVRDGYIFT